MKVKCLIVDDEELALDVLDGFIKQVEFLELTAKCKSAIEALSIVKSKKIDLVFLDIQMPGLTGLQLLKNVSHLPEVIITTAYSDYAVESFELEALDYLLKPIPFERFLKAVNRYLSKNDLGKPTVTFPANLINQQTSFFVKWDKQMVNVFLDDVLYVESIRNHIVIHLKNKTQIKTLSTIRSIEEKLPEQEFLRIHRSFVIATNKIQSFTGGGVIIVGKFIPFGRNYKEHALHILLKKEV